MISVGLYDSGIGGVSILETLQEQIKLSLPDRKVRYLYFCDNLHYPYGTKNSEDLVSFVCETVRKMLDVYQLDILIIACNTASTVVLPYLRDLFPIPIVGVVPAIKPACKQSRTKHVCLLATQATITRPSLEELIQLYGNGCDILRIGSSLLVEIAERKFRNYPVDDALIEQEIKPIFSDYLIDTLILGCTHFVHLKDSFTKILSKHPQKITIIDSSLGVSSHCIDLLNKVVIPNKKDQDDNDSLNHQGLDFHRYDESLLDKIFVFTKKDDTSIELIEARLEGKYCIAFL